MNKIEHGQKIKYHVSFAVILLACFCMIMQMYAIPMKNMALMSLANRVTLLLWIVAVCVSLFVYGTNGMMEIITLIGLTLIAFVFSVVDYMRSFSMTGILNFCALPFILVFLSCNEVQDVAKKVLLLTFFILSILLIGFSEADFAYRIEGEYAIVNIDDLTMGYPNQNQAAFYLFICAINLVIGAFYFKRKWLKVLFAADFLYMVVLLEKTKCRTTLILIGIFLLLIVIPKKSKVLINIAVLYPLIFAISAQLLYPYLEDFTFFGDSLLNGREEIFGRYFDHLSLATILFGDFQRFNYDNLHNAYVAIAATAGIPVLICYIYMLRKHMHRNWELGIQKGYEVVAFIGVVCILLYASTEAAGLIGGTNYAFMSLSSFMYFSKPFAKISKA